MRQPEGCAMLEAVACLPRWRGDDKLVQDWDVAQAMLLKRVQDALPARCDELLVAPCSTHTTPLNAEGTLILLDRA